LLAALSRKKETELENLTAEQIEERLKALAA
jgi:hypothetical protein